MPAMSPEGKSAAEGLRALQGAFPVGGTTTQQQEADPWAEGACVVCLAEKATHAFVPCGHKAVCRDCAARCEEKTKENSQNPTCVICRNSFVAVVRIFEV